MKQELKENQGLPASLLWTLAIIAGISVANLYYNQPLLNRISRDLQTSEFTANLIAMITQIGYAIGLLFIIPLGDLFKRKTIILINFTVLVVSLLTIALNPYIHLILFASLLTGICSVMPQIFIPIAAQFSTPETKGKNVGMIVSGLLTGILASRVVSGIIGEYLGWRFIFFVAAGMMVICVIIIMRVLPDMPCNFKGRYSDLMKSLFSLVMEYPQLRISSLRAGIAFGSFLALWTSLAFKMEQAPFFAGNNIVGLLGAHFLQGLPNVKVIRCENTAVAARMVAESGRDDVAALSSRACRELYGLDCLAASVQDQGNNFTRFICIAKNLEIYPGADRTSLMMVLPHHPGSLYKVLSRFNALGVNMNKLESRPMPDRNFEFMFYFDLETSVYTPQFTQLMGELPELCEEFTYLGSYSEVV